MKNSQYSVIKTVDLQKIYSLGKIDYPALRGVNIDIKQGEFVAIVGPSGSGKSTLLNLFGALDRPTKGNVFIDGIDISKLSENDLASVRNKKMGFVFQTFNLLNYLNSIQNIEVPLVAANIPSSVRLRKASETLERVGLKGYERNRPTELSGGQQQRVAVARALANNPHFLLMDEPTGNVDSKTAREVISLIKKLNQDGVTIILVTHDQNLSKEARRTIHVMDGEIASDLVN